MRNDTIYYLHWKTDRQASCQFNPDVAVFRLPTRLLAIIVSISYIYISQGSVATQLKCAGIFTNYFIANFPSRVPVKGFGKIG